MSHWRIEDAMSGETVATYDGEVREAALAMHELASLIGRPLVLWSEAQVTRAP